MDYFALARAMGSEIGLVLTALAVLAVDLSRGRRLSIEARRQVAGAITMLGAALSAIPLVWQMSALGEVAANGTLVATPLTVIFRFVLIGLTALTALISVEHEIGRHVGEYFAMLLLATVGMVVLVGTEELLTFFIALELTSLSLYVLVAFQKDRLASQEAALKYFLFGAIASAFLLFGLSYLYGLTGSTNLREIGAATGQQGPLFAVGLLCVLVGLGFKIAVVPFHLWAPDAYEGAPTPVTAFIATGSKVASFFVLVKMLVVGFEGATGAILWGGLAPGWALWLGVAAAASMILGNCAAIVQRNVKRLLAYSSIAHAGYIVVGLVAVTQTDRTGAAAVLFYLIVYALTNLGALGVIAVVAGPAGGENREHFNGMAGRSPYLSLLMLVFLLSLAGVPPLGGFFGKFYLFAAAVQRDATGFGLLWLVGLGIVMSAVSLYYYLIVMKHFYVEPAADETPVRAPGHVNVALGLVALAVVLLGVFPEPVVALLRSLAGRL